MHHNFLDQYSGLESFLHSVDPRAKIIVFLGIVLFVLLTPPLESISLLFYGLLIFVLICLSRLPLYFIFSRSLVIVPFVMLVGLSLLFPLTKEKMGLLAHLLLKAYLSILSVILMVSTTKFSDLLKALEKMRCPVVFLMIFSFMYRYLYLLLDEFMKMNLARESRTVHSQCGFAWSKIKSLSNMIGCLLIRSYERGENVYLAMCSRGYQGQIKTLHPFVLRNKDYGILLLVFFYLTTVKILISNYV